MEETHFTEEALTSLAEKKEETMIRIGWVVEYQMAFGTIYSRIHPTLKEAQAELDLSSGGGAQVREVFVEVDRA